MGKVGALCFCGRPCVIVLVGGYIPEGHEAVTQRAIEVIAAFAEENPAAIICGGTTVGIMGSIGQIRAALGYKFPLLGITLENRATWPNGPRGKKFLWWGKERWPLSPGYSHFLLVPGDQFGEDSPWLVEAATCLSQGVRSVTVLGNGGGVARNTSFMASKDSGEPSNSLNIVVTGGGTNTFWSGGDFGYAGSVYRR